MKNTYITPNKYAVLCVWWISQANHTLSYYKRDYACDQRNWKTSM